MIRTVIIEIVLLMGILFGLFIPRPPEQKKFDLQIFEHERDKTTLVSEYRGLAPGEKIFETGLEKFTITFLEAK